MQYVWPIQGNFTVPSRMEIFYFNNPLFQKLSILINYTQGGVMCTTKKKEKSLQLFVYLLILFASYWIKYLPFLGKVSWYKRNVNATGFIRPSTTAELNTLMWKSWTALSLNMKVKWWSLQDQITDPQDRNACLFIHLVTKRSGNVSYQFSWHPAFKHASKQSPTKLGVGRATPGVHILFGKNIDPCQRV